MQTLVTIKQNSWMARLAAKKLGEKSVAMVIGKTIYLHNVLPNEFLQNKAWVCHELIHIQQFKRNGTFLFLIKYLWESLKKGYYNNKYEIEARENEDNVELLKKFEITVT